MLSPVELPIYPHCFDALAWSPDGELAVAAGEQIQILVSTIPSIANAITDSQVDLKCGSIDISASGTRNMARHTLPRQLLHLC